MQLIYEKSVAGRRAVRLPKRGDDARPKINAKLLRTQPAALPQALQTLHAHSGRMGGVL